MSSKKDGIIVILSSPSGAGKTTLVKEISNKNNFKVSISHTTRKPRTNEINGKDYYFINNNEFETMIKNDEFIEHAKVFDNLYGSRKKVVLDHLNNGNNVIFDIDWQGTEQIKQKKLNYLLITFFILPPSRKVLFERLSNRDMKDKLIVEERMKQFDQDILKWVNYDYVVINDDLNTCYLQILNLIDLKLNKKNLDYNKSNSHLR